MEIFLELLTLLLLTRIFGELAERFNQPSSVGEILAGVLLAIMALWFGNSMPFVANLASSEVLEAVANIGIFVLVLYAGIELEPREVARSSKAAFFVALGGTVLPLAGGFALAWVFLPENELRPIQALLTGVALSISAIPATVKVFTDLGLLHSRVGEYVIAAAVIDDVIGLFLLALLLAVIDTGEVPGLIEFLWILAKVFCFFSITLVLGAKVYPRVSRGVKALQAAAFEFSALALVALAYGVLAELLDMHWILGAFMAGLYFERNRVGAKAYNEIKLIFATLARGFLGPLFFAYIGLQVDLAAAGEAPVFLIMLIAVAFLGKLLGAGLPALASGLSGREACAVGIGLSARGAVELVILSIAYEKGLFGTFDAEGGGTDFLFSSLIIMGVVTTTAVPLLLRKVLRQDS